MSFCLSPGLSAGPAGRTVPVIAASCGYYTMIDRPLPASRQGGGACPGQGFSRGRAVVPGSGPAGPGIPGAARAGAESHPGNRVKTRRFFAVMGSKSGIGQMSKK